LNKGCVCAFIDKKEAKKDNRFILVDNTVNVLQELANYHRKQFNIPVIVIGGSNGKTTTKELIKNILSKKYDVFATFGNLNNHIGVPLSLLQINKKMKLLLLK